MLSCLERCKVSGLLDLFAGVLSKCSGQRIGVTALEKDQVLGWGAAAVFLHRIVHTIFPGDLLKFLDGRVCDLNIGDPLILTNELLDGLFAVRCHRSVTASLLLQLLFLQWAMYLLMAALSSRPVNFVPLTTSVKVLFSTSSCIFIASFPQSVQGWCISF